jgi:MHS family proline/betaine transporter-like MFS transporter
MGLWKKTSTVALGKALEYYDLAVYVALAVYIKQKFLPDSVFGVYQEAIFWLMFGLRYVARPVSGYLLGRYADQYGKRNTLVLISLCTGVATVVLACLPTYEQIGITATLIFFSMQMVQSLFFAGETATAYAYILEQAKPNQRSRACAALGTALILSFILSFGITSSLESWLTAEQMHQFGWRIPMLFGLFNIMLSYYLRSKLNEVSSPQRQRFVFKQEWPAVLKVVSVFAPSAMLFHCSIANLTTLKKFVTEQQLDLAFDLPLLFKLLTLVFAGGFSCWIDQRSSCEKAFKATCLAMMVLGVPVYYLQSLQTLPAVMASQLLITILLSLVLSALGEVVYRGIRSQAKVAVYALGMNLGSLFFGAFVPMLTTYLMTISGFLPGLLWLFAAGCYFAASSERFAIVTQPKPSAHVV